MEWVLALAGMWVVVALSVAFVVGRSIRLADRRADDAHRPDDPALALPAGRRSTRYDESA